ncbi:hypothetical protein F2P81_004705 [Scophthalmus maximus]|uniref:60S ribosome subunit biogenesis protein NIP7 homolog n=4 Tax=Scophthalmus maximus TaxID=52904 RepID=A0A6A4TG08_SCOMX|nr:hypothetical protein F2P81_004705 [Scophthalmus maximus]
MLLASILRTVARLVNDRRLRSPIETGPSVTTSVLTHVSRCSTGHSVHIVFLSYIVKMRPLTDEETKTMFEKLSKYIGENIKLLVDRPDGTYCFRLHNDRVYYMSEKILKLATNFSRDKLVSVGTCFGKFTKTTKFRMHITALDFLAPYAKFKVWVKPGTEQSFLYGNHVLKSGLGRITENTMQYQGVVVYSMADVPLGFGVAAKTTQECRRVDPMSIVVFHQADVGEFIRNEDTLT